MKCTCAEGIIRSKSAMKVLLLLTVLTFLNSSRICLAVEHSGSVRLRGGHTPFEGRVEILFNNSWGTIRDTNWNFEDASVVCRQLGFIGAESASLGGEFVPAHASTPVLLTNVNCSERAQTVWDCTYETLSIQSYSRHTEDAGARCAVRYSIRLHNITSSNVGRLDIYYGSDWSPICFDRSWTSIQYSVLCRQLGYEQVLSYRGVSADGAVTLQALNCSGNEPNIQACSSPITVQRSCSNQMALNLECAGAPLQPHPPTTSFITCTSITLTWSLPHNRGYKIISYSLRYRPYTSYLLANSQILPWTNISVNTSDLDRPIVTLQKLQPLAAFEFQISATNHLGTSPYSESTVVMTSAPEINTPSMVSLVTTGQTTAEISWMEPVTCGIENITYEVSYAIEGRGLPSVSFQDSVIPTRPGVTQHYEINELLPFTQYSVRVRVMGYVNAGDEIYTIQNYSLSLFGGFFVSDFSDITKFITERSAPTGSPQAFVAFFSIIQSTAHFQWEPVSPHLANGVVTGYVITCHYQNDRIQQMIVSNSTYMYSLENLEAASDYECTVAARNEIGQGPGSTPILFTTPADLSQRPSAPRNVVFEIVEQNRDSLFIGAQWEMFVCQSNFSCIEILGYVITCRVDSSGAEVRTTVWLSDYASIDEVFENAKVPADYFTTYVCEVSSLNTYGAGQPGSRSTITTPETVPTQSPSLLYTSNVEAEAFQVHWTYSESPKPGRLIGFTIYWYEQEPRFPQRPGINELKEFYDASSETEDQTEFSYELMYLKPGVAYNVYVAAATIVGEGPRTRVSVTTHRRAPSTTFEYVFTSITSTSEPFPTTVEWSIATPNQQIDHFGYIVYCYDNTTSPSVELLSHVVFDVTLRASYSADIVLLATCDRPMTIYQCAVSAFNERGEGEKSFSLPSSLPCTGRDEGLSGTFLSNPYVGISFLILVILLVITLATSIIICCFCIIHYENRGKKEEHYSTVPFDEGYISMAPSGSNTSAAKLPWPRANRYPSPFSRGRNTRLSFEQENHSPYDEISSERMSKLTENVYDEIPLRLTPPSRSNASSLRSSPALQQTVTCPSIHTSSSCHSEKSFDLNESQVTTLTDLTKSDNHMSIAKKLSPVSSEESLDKPGPQAKVEPKHFKDQPNLSTSRSRTSGYVEVVTTKDGKRCIRELGEDKDIGNSQPASTTVLGTKPSSSTAESHSYQNVAEIKRPKSASSTRFNNTAITVNRRSIPNQSRRQKVTSADFQLATVDDSDV